ncbi:hypothetical protein [Segniliparus rugosus]|uniref:Uncharacterized protein n=1 Tax=Segniliparus rugosus (strain ATCC BAA-974 / DSM 45345 / CCUG 50838 / CIP 108380 / JCM 13579 / CDC 945) TaxID=679197 RepID=E5XT35_SEGRC|nr:hypothetical protein [Segniliparus rugosus]EFV12492.1 hypothetical protein HMPREF9336_02657 [Segniliparus rugosus ATCC BAA-974]
MTTFLIVLLVVGAVITLLSLAANRTDTRRVDDESPYADAQRTFIRLIESEEGKAFLTSCQAASKRDGEYDGPSVSAVHETSVDLSVPAGKAAAFNKRSVLDELGNVVSARLSAKPIGGGQVRISFSPFYGEEE